MNDVLLDTCIVIDFLRGKPEAVAYIHSLSNAPYLSSATVMELYAGVRGSQEEQQLANMVAHSKVLEICGEIGAQAGKLLKQYRPSTGLDAIDALIAATAKHNDVGLVTLNIKHFAMFKGLARPY